MSTLHALGRRCPVASVTIIIKCHPREVALTVGIAVSLDCRPAWNDGVTLPAASRPGTAAQDTGALAAASQFG